MFKQLLISVPGPWRSRGHFIQCLMTAEPSGRFKYQGNQLKDMTEHGGEQAVGLDLLPPDPDLAALFEAASRGGLCAETVAGLHQHQAVAMLHLTLDLKRDGPRLLRFTRLLRRVGGLAIHVETCGLAHTWDRWFALVAGSLFDMYRAVVTPTPPTAGRAHYASCGMRHFNLPDCAVPDRLIPAKAIELINQFNWWQLTERCSVRDGNTFSLGSQTPRFRLAHQNDSAHRPGQAEFNEHGVRMLQSLGDAIALPARPGHASGVLAPLTAGAAALQLRA